jgi:hypothetical protein
MNTVGKHIANGGIDKNMVDNDDEMIEIMTETFVKLCKSNPPEAFIAFTVGKDMMVNFASYGLDQTSTVDLLKHMLEYIEEKNPIEEEIDFGKDDNTTIH